MVHLLTFSQTKAAHKCLDGNEVIDQKDLK